MRRVVRDRLRSTAIVTLKDGSSFRCVLYDFDREAFALRSVEHLTPGADRPTPVDGELLVMVADVSFIQII